MWGAVLLGAAAILAGRLLTGLSIQTDIRALLPAADRPPLLQAFVDRLQDQAMARSIFLLGGPDLQAVETAANAARETFTRSAIFAVEDVEKPGSLAPNSAMEQSAPLLLAGDDRQALLEQSAEYWVERAQRRLLGWGAMTSRTGFADDPFGLFDRYLRQGLPDTGFEARGPCLHKLVDGQHWCLLVLNAAQSNFGLDLLRRQREALDAAVHAAESAAPGVSVLDAGISRHADYAARASQHEMSRISVVSLLGIALLALVLMQSLRPLLWVAAVLGSGALCGLAACSLFFAELHLVALVFGTTLIGIAVDYAFHYLTAAGTPERRIVNIESGLFWGYVTTATAFAALGFAGIPALQQVAITSVAGLGGALLAVHWLLPALPERWLANPRPSLLAIATRIERSSRGSERSGILLILVLFLLIGVGVLGAWKLNVGENVRALHPVNDALLARDIEARRIVAGADAAQSLLIHDSDPELVLRQAELLQPLLSKAVAAKEIREWMSPQALLVSQARQVENRRLLQAYLLQPGGPIERLQQQLGLPAAWAEGYREKVNAAVVMPALAWGLPSTVMGTNIPVEAKDAVPADNVFAKVWAGWWYGSPGESAMVIRLGGVAKPGAFHQRMDQAAAANVLVVDGIADASAALAHTRKSAMQALLVVGMLIGAVFLWQFGLRSIALLTPSAVSVLSVLGVLGWTGQSFGLFHLLSLLLVAGMSIDYALFLHEAGPAADRSILAIVASGLTTIAAFGMLGLSATPALAAMGQIVGLGVASALVLSLLLLRSGWLESPTYV